MNECALNMICRSVAAWSSARRGCWACY